MLVMGSARSLGVNRGLLAASIIPWMYADSASTVSFPGSCMAAAALPAASSAAAPGAHTSACRRLIWPDAWGCRALDAGFRGA